MSYEEEDTHTHTIYRCRRASRSISQLGTRYSARQKKVKPTKLANKPTKLANKPTKMANKPKLGTRFSGRRSALYIYICIHI
jgi:hypothetical protein